MTDGLRYPAGRPFTGLCAPDPLPPFPVLRAPRGRLRLCFLSQDYPPGPTRRRRCAQARRQAARHEPRPARSARGAAPARHLPWRAPRADANQPRRAALLAFPSVHVGFGISAVEALTTGTRVAVSAGTSIEEAAGPHGEPIASRDVEGWRDAMRRALDAPAPTEAERDARRAWARRFDWRRTASRSLAMYRAVLDGVPLPAELLEA